MNVPDAATRTPVPVAIGLGSNLGDRLAALRAGFGALSTLLSDIRASRVFETVPLHLRDQPAFLNACVTGTTGIEPEDLLRALKEVERGQGRAADGPRYGPRILDLDLLLYGDGAIWTPELTVPHPRMHERAFVLVPLAELAPNWQHAGLGRTIRELRDGVPDVGVRSTEWRLERPGDHE